MNIENQVISLELAKKLKELDVEQESLFYWIIGNDDLPKVTELSDTSKYMLGGNYRSAFTLSELLNILPTIKCHEPQLIRGRLKFQNELKYCCRYDFYDLENILFIDSNPANSCAKFLIFLIENKDEKKYIPPNAYDLIFTKDKK